MEVSSSNSSSSAITSSLTVSEDLEEQLKELIPSLPKVLEGTTFELSLYQGFWCPTGTSPLRGVFLFQKCFEAQDTDIFVASNPKTGTTWLKALTFSIVNHTRFTPSNTPLLTSNPHDLVPFLDFDLYTQDQIPNLSNIPSPRLFAVHSPYSALPDSVKQSNCPIIYVCRNPFDTVVSLCHFCNVFATKDDVQSIENFFNLFIKGISPFGPFWDHVLGYWKESLERPDKVLFLKYEDMKVDIGSCLKKIAKFVGYPFSKEEEKNGVIEEIAKLCSLSTLKDLEVNKNGTCMSRKYANKAFFRKGEVGDGIDGLSSSMKKELQTVIGEKLKGSGLSFELPF